MAWNQRFCYFHPNAFEERHFEGFFIDEDKYRENPSWLLNKMCNTLTSDTQIAIEDWSVAVVDVSPLDSDGFVIPDDRTAAIRLERFKMDNTPVLISAELNNNAFYVVDTAGDNQLTADELHASTLTEYIIPTGYYPDQSTIFDVMYKLCPDVKFAFTPRQTINYVGSKPLLMPILGSPKFWQSHSQIRTTSQFKTMPPNIKGLTQTNSTNVNATFTTEVNGKAIDIVYDGIPFYQDLLVAKLGFIGGDASTATIWGEGSGVRYYFDYPQQMALPNTSGDLTAELNGKKGSTFVVIYPDAEGGACGNVYGAMSNVTIFADDVFAPYGQQNALAKINVQGQPSYTTFEISDASEWVPLSAQQLYKKFRFRLVDDYQRPYRLCSGPPFIRLMLKVM
jgi:hypothetical protein